MSAREKSLFCWSGGKDSAMALHTALSAGRHEIVGLVTTVSEEFDRVSHHGVRRALLEAQAAALGLPLEIVYIGTSCDTAEYETMMHAMHLRYREAGVTTVIFGDIFLAPLRQYREEKLAQVGMRAHFPLWGENTGQLVRRFLASGFGAVLCSVDTEALPADFAGRELDEALLAALPAGVDPCGENGEYHSFVYKGPIFRAEIPVIAAQRVVRGRMAFCELLDRAP